MRNNKNTKLWPNWQLNYELFNFFFKKRKQKRKQMDKSNDKSEKYGWRGGRVDDEDSDLFGK